ncbi:MAG: class I SAM-dependent methyltransferase [Acidimicrobiales bacterium]
MSAALEHLERVVPAAPGRPELAGDDHPMRAVTRQIAFEPGGWTPERAAKVTALFDGLAIGWQDHDAEERMDPLFDALARGGHIPSRHCLEVGSGTGMATPCLADYFDSVVAIDLSFEMLKRAPPRCGHRVLADGSRLPVADGSVDSVVLMNAFLFPAEVDRVLARAGVVIWVNALGDRTPIYLPADDVVAALPGSWKGVCSEAGWGSWAVLRRST